MVDHRPRSRRIRSYHSGYFYGDHGTEPDQWRVERTSTFIGIDEDGDGVIDMYFEHRQCEHVWGDVDGDGDEECLKCGLIKND